MDRRVTEFVKVRKSPEDLPRAIGRGLCDLKDFDIHARIMKCEDFCFRSFILSFLSHRKHRTIKGGRGKK